MKVAARFIVRLIVRFFARILVVPLCHLIEPVWKLRLTPLFTARFGHLSLNTYLYVAQQRLGQGEKCKGRLFFGANPCNRQLFDMWHHLIPIYESRVLTGLYMNCQDIVSEIPMFRVLPDDCGIDERYIPNAHELVTTCGGVLEFTPREHERGRDLLQEMGLGEDDWFVCFQARDSSYHEKRIGSDYARHRNAKIESFLEAAQMITDMGGFAIRIGSTVEKPLPDGLDPRIIDYATKHRSDFGDVYLLGNCRFFLGSSTGTTTVPMLFGTPVALTNLVPAVPNVCGRNSLFISKLLKDKKTGQLATYETFFELIGSAQQYNLNSRHWNNAEIYESDRYTLINNSSEEIAELCQDMFDLLEGKEPTQEATDQQDAFGNRHLKDLPDVNIHGPRIGPRFSVKYSDLI